MEKQPIEIQTLYAELIERLVALDAERTIGHLPGTFVTKRVKGQEYCYFQHLGPGGSKRQIYVGRQDELLLEVIRKHEVGRAGIAADRQAIERICSLLKAGPSMTTDHASARVLRSLADAGVFRLGGVVVGTVAFGLIGNLLGVKWRASTLRTQDIDIAAEQKMSIAMPHTSADIPTALEGLQMGFLPVPGLDPRSSSTLFKVRGQGLRVDLLSPSDRGDSRPVTLARFKAAAQPLRFLELLMKNTVRGAVIDAGGVLVNLPDPARFAFHKLIVAVERPAAMHTKSEKDLRQAIELFEVLSEERPGDIGVAWEDIASRGESWTSRARGGLEAMARLDLGLAERIRSSLPKDEA